jgi:predicted glycoside hydrolase/deacetylase ChbG (UPF0249 family)
VSGRYLIVNADDFGASPGVNRGVARAHEHGILTSASLMVRAAAAAGAAAYARDHPDLSLGLHVDLGEWRFQGGGWRTVYEVVPTADAEAVAAEAGRQLEAFRLLAGVDPTHLDSHQHVHRDEPVRSALARIASRLDVPLRHFSPRVRYRGDFFGQTGEGEPVPAAIDVDALLALIPTLEPGVTELGCHPGAGDDTGSVYGAERAVEVETLCDPRVREALSAGGIELCSFGHPAVSAAAA